MWATKEAKKKDSLISNFEKEVLKTRGIRQFKKIGFIKGYNVCNLLYLIL